MPGFALLAAEVVGFRRAANAAGLLEDLIVIHGYMLKRAERRAPAAPDASEFMLVRRPRGR